MTTAIDQLISRGVVIVAASGNGILYNTESLVPTDVLPFPASHPDVITVSGVEKNGTQIGQYAVGTHTDQHHVDVLAPGKDILCASARTLGYHLQSGTSLAAPQVTGLVGLMLSANSLLTSSQIRSILRNTATKLPGMNGNNFTKQYGYGEVNALAAIVGATVDAETLKGQISTNRTVPSAATTFSNVYLPSDVRVYSTATLTISAGTNVYIADGDSLNIGSESGRIEVLVDGGGAIVAAGTSGSPISFRSYKSTIAETRWSGVKVSTGGSLLVSHSTFKNGAYGVAVSAPDTLAITNCNFSSNSNIDILLGGAGGYIAALIADNYIEIKGGTGITIRDSNGGRVRVNAISR